MMATVFFRKTVAILHRILSKKEMSFMTNPTEPLYKLNRTRDSLCFFWICWLTYFCTYLGRLNFSASMAEIISAEGFSKSALGMVGRDVYKRQSPLWYPSEHSRNRPSCSQFQGWNPPALLKHCYYRDLSPISLLKSRIPYSAHLQ